MASTVLLSSIFTGCGCSNTKNGAEEDIKNGVEKSTDNVQNATESIKDVTKDLFETLKDKSMAYSKEDFVNALKTKGITVEEVENKTEYFTANKYAYKINNETVYVYEYEANDTDKLKEELNSISEGGNKIKGSTIEWKTKPHIYKKGRIISIYDGKNEDTLKLLSEILGDPIL